MKQFSEATRVQMPAMVHLTRIGYTYFGKLSEDKNGTVYDGDTNILLPILSSSSKAESRTRRRISSSVERHP